MNDNCNYLFAASYMRRGSADFTQDVPVSAQLQCVTGRSCGFDSSRVVSVGEWQTAIRISGLKESERESAVQG